MQLKKHIKLLELAGLLISALCIAFPPVLKIALASEGSLILWSSTITHILRWPVVILSLGTASWLIFRQSLHTIAAAVLFLLISVTFLADILPTGSQGCAYLLLPALWISIHAARLMQSQNLSIFDRLSDTKLALLMFACLAIIYTTAGTLMATMAGEVNGGDEAAYIIQAQSLYEDHDLDIRNNWEALRNNGKRMEKPGGDMHISGHCKDDAWYTWHFFGLPLLLMPFVPLGLIGHYIVLGTIGAASMAILFLACSRTDAGRRASLLAGLGLSLSAPVMFYSGRLFAEIVGALLVSCIAWAITAQRDRQWLSLFIAAIAVTYLPPTHTRFLILSVVGAGLYGLTILHNPAPWSRRIILACVFTIICIAGWSATFFQLNRMFITISSPDTPMLISRTLGTLIASALPPGADPAVLSGYPTGMWAAIADTRGLAPVFPVITFMLPATVAAMCIPKKRFFGILPLLAFLLYLASSCSNIFSAGPGSMPGRYLICILPVLTIPAAIMLKKGRTATTMWFAFLCAVSTTLMILTISYGNRSGDDLVHPLRSLATYVPAFSGIIHPFASFFESSTSAARTVGTIFVCMMTAAGSLIILRPKPKLLTAVACGLVLTGTAIACHLLQPTKIGRVSWSPRAVAELLSNKNRDTARVIIQRSGPFNIFDIARLPLLDGAAQKGITIHASTNQVPPDANHIDLRKLEVNDWKQRNIAWATLVRPRNPSTGYQAIRIKGQFTGEGQPSIVIREGNQTLISEKIQANKNTLEQTWSFHCQGNAGHLYVLATIKGEGVLHLDSVDWAPIASGFEKISNAVIYN